MVCSDACHYLNGVGYNLLESDSNRDAWTTEKKRNNQKKRTEKIEEKKRGLRGIVTKLKNYF